MRYAIVMMFAATAAFAEVPVGRIADDARAADRIAAASKHDMPVELLRRMFNEDIELLRGRRSDGGYDFASYERLEAGRTSDSFSVEGNGDPAKLTKLETKGSWVYRLAIESPSRRLLVTKNRPVFIDHVEIEYIPEKGGASKRQNVKIESVLEPGTTRNVDLDEIAKQATARVFARTDPDSGYGNVTLSMIQARISDNPDSPYADAVASAKAVLRAVEHDDPASMRSMAQRMVNDLQPKATDVVPVTPRTMEVVASRTDLETMQELQAIEDLLTGNEAERRQGLDRLHQLIRKLRPAGK